MTYNVHGLRSGIRTVGRAIRAQEPDVVVLQESGGRLPLLRMGAVLGMQVAGDPVSFPRRRVKNAVLVRLPWRLRAHRFHRFAGGARLYPRGVLIAEISDGSRWFTVASVHLGLRPAERMRHAVRLEERVLAAAQEGSAVIGGDLNEFEDGRAVGLLAERFDDAWPRAQAAGNAEGSGATFPSWSPSARIDYVFASRDLAVRAARVPSDPTTARASDHLPVVVEIDRTA